MADIIDSTGGDESEEMQGVASLPDGDGSVDGSNDITQPETKTRKRPTAKSNGRTSPPVDSPNPDVEDDTESEEALVQALIRRGRDTSRRSVKFTREQEDQLVQKIVQDFEDAAGDMQVFKQKHADYLAVWRGVLEDKEPPFEGAANIHMPMTSSFIEQMKARFYKALFGGDMYAMFSSLDESIKQEVLTEVNTWFQFELDEVVEIKKCFGDGISHDLLVDGFSLPVPYYDHRERMVQSVQEYDIQDMISLQDQMRTAISDLFPDENPVITVKGLGIFEVEHTTRESGTNVAHVEFSIKDETTLCAEVERLEVVFDGVCIERTALEDLVVINSNPDLELIPFFGKRLWLSVFDFINSGEYIEFDEDENSRIIAFANSKIGEFVGQERTDISDQEEGTNSKDISGVDPSRRYLEVYRSELHWSFQKKDKSGYRSIYDTTGYAAWVVAGARRIIKIERLDELTIDGGRTPVKFDFIVDPDRFFPIGLGEWLRHLQTLTDGIVNQRLDAGTLANIPFGFYEPTAGLSQNIIKWKPGHMYPTKNAAGIKFPEMNWQPFWSFKEEQNVKQYAQEQAGMGGSSVGSFSSKRTTASEFAGTSEAIDLRTEYMADRIFRAFRKLLWRVFGLYQRYAKEGRIFQVSGANGERIVRRLKKDWLQGKLTLHLTANVQQLSAQLQRDIAVEMMSLLLNPLLINMGVVKPDTIYAAIDKVARTSGYRGVLLHHPDVPEDSPPPDVEHKMMMHGEEVQPHPTENFNEHLSAHMRFVSMPNIMDYLPTPESRQMLSTHIEQTWRMQRAVNIMRQQQALEAAQLQHHMETLGVRPGKPGGSSPGDQAQPGTAQEGVEGGPNES